MPWCDRLDDYLNEYLDEREREAFAEHLLNCGACAGEVELQRRIEALLRASVHSESAPAGLVKRTALAMRGLRWRRLAAWSAAASLLLALTVGGFARIDPHPEPSPSQRVPSMPIESLPRAHVELPSNDPHTPSPKERHAAPADSQVARKASDAPSVDAGRNTIVVPVATVDPRVHVFWIYPTADVSFTTPEGASFSSETEGNSL